MEYIEPENPIAIGPPIAENIPQFVYWDIKSVVRLFFIFLLYSLIAGVLAGIILVAIDTAHLESELLKSLLNLFVYAIAMLVTIKYAMRKSRDPRDSPFDIKFNSAQAWLLPIIIISTLGLVIILASVSDLIPMPPSVKKFFEGAFRTDIFSVTAVMVAAPILEEILCRGIVLKGLLENYPPYKAILISAILFGALHLNPWQAAPAFLSGLFLGWTYYKTQSVVPGMVIHATVNITATAMLFLSKSQSESISLFYSHHGVILCIGALIIFFGGSIVINQQISVNRGVVEVS